MPTARPFVHARTHARTHAAEDATMRLWLATAERMVRYAFDLSAALRDADNEMGDAIAAELVRVPSQAKPRREPLARASVLHCG